MEFLAFPEQHVCARVEQESPENVEHPRKVAQQRGSDGDHRAAQHQRTDQPPTQNAMLQAFLNGKGPKVQEKDEQVIYTEGLLDQVAGEEFQCWLPPVAPEDRQSECDGDANPESAPEGGFAQ